MQYTTTTRHSWATCELAQHRGTCQHRDDISVQPVWLVSQKESYFQCLCSQSWRFQLKFPYNASLCLWPLSVSPHIVNFRQLELWLESQPDPSTLVHSDTHQNYQKKIVPCENLHMGRLLGPWRPDCTRSGFLNSFSRHVLFRNSNNVAPSEYNVSLVM